MALQPSEETDPGNPVAVAAPGLGSWLCLRPHCAEGRALAVHAASTWVPSGTWLRLRPLPNPAVPCEGHVVAGTEIPLRGTRTAEQSCAASVPGVHSVAGGGCLPAAAERGWCLSR